MEMAATGDPKWFGPAHLDGGWAPAPRYLMRRARILHHMRDMPPGDLVEVGSASGALLSEFSARGFRCAGVETSEEALALAQRVNAESAISFRAVPDPTWRECFDYCFSFEVIEHIERDLAALSEWATWLRPGGRLFLSAPAHPRLWNAGDVWAGHYRRYRKEEMERIIAEAGLSLESIECYGFPLSNMLEILAAPKYRQSLQQHMRDEMVTDKAAQTASSGIERKAHVNAFRYYSRAPGSVVMRFMIMAQRIFLKTGFGNGYFAVARKPSSF